VHDFVNVPSGVCTASASQLGGAPPAPELLLDAELLLATLDDAELLLATLDDAELLLATLDDAELLLATLTPPAPPHPEPLLAAVIPPAPPPPEVAALLISLVAPSVPVTSGPALAELLTALVALAPEDSAAGMKSSAPRSVRPHAASSATATIGRRIMRPAQASGVPDKKP
jgi:hypothetical protein